MINFTLCLDVFILLLDIIVLLFLLFPLRFPVSVRMSSTDTLMVVVFLSAVSAFSKIDFTSFTLLNSAIFIANLATLILIVLYMIKRHNR